MSDTLKRQACLDKLKAEWQKRFEQIPCKDIFLTTTSTSSQTSTHRGITSPDMSLWTTTESKVHIMTSSSHQYTSQRVPLSSSIHPASSSQSPEVDIHTITGSMTTTQDIILSTPSMPPESKLWGIEVRFD